MRRFASLLAPRHRRPSRAGRDGHARRAGVLVLVCLPLLLAPSTSQAAGTTTGIVRAHSNLDVYTYTPTETGYLRITIGWTELDGDPVGGYPAAEVDVCVQSYDGWEPYADWDVAQLHSGVNPSTATITVNSYNVGHPFVFSVSPAVGDVRYRLTVDFRRTPVSSYTRVVDATGEAHPTAGEVPLPATATWWHSVVHDWPGDPRDLHAFWMDQVRGRKGSILVGDGAAAWLPPVVSDAPATAAAGDWVAVLPCIWHGAARPNVWFDPMIDSNPKPGSLAVGSAPAWYTWAYADSAAPTSAPAYTLGARITTQASGCSLSAAAEPGATASYSFVGDTLGWLYAAGPQGGPATLTVDGDPERTWTVDQYAPAMTYGRRLDLEGLGPGPHTVLVESEAGLYHDAFLAPTDAADPIPLAEDQSDGATRYSWAHSGAGFASGFSYSYAAAQDAATAFTFNGTSFTWRYVRRPDGGLAQVWIDGVDKRAVDQYGRRNKRRGAPLAGSVTYTGLGSGTHTVLIVNTGQSSPDSYGTVVSSDGFTVGGVTFED